MNSTWDFYLWEEAAVPRLADAARNGGNLIMELDRITHAHEASDPIAPHPLAHQTVKNRMVDSGLSELAARSAGVRTSSEAYHAIGTNSDPTLAGMTALQAEVVRKQVGTREHTGPTVRCASAFFPADIPSLGAGQTVNITEASLQTGPLNHADDVMMVRVVNNAVPVSAGRFYMASTLITYRNGTGG